MVCTAEAEIQFFYTTLRVFVDGTLQYEPPVGEAPNHKMTLAIPPGARLGLTGHRDVNPDTLAVAVRLTWAAPVEGPEGAPILSSAANWTGARVSPTWAAEWGGGVAGDTLDWAPTADVTSAVSAPFRRSAPAGAAHIAIPEEGALPGAAPPGGAFWVAIRSPPLPATPCIATATGDDHGVDDAAALPSSPTSSAGVDSQTSGNGDDSDDEDGGQLSTGAIAGLSVGGVVVVVAVVAAAVRAVASRRAAGRRIAQGLLGGHSVPGSGACGNVTSQGGGGGGGSGGGGDSGGGGHTVIATLARPFRSGRRGGPRRGGHLAGGVGGPASEVATLDNAPAWDGWAAQSDAAAGGHAGRDGGGGGVESSSWCLAAAEAEATMENQILAAVDALCKPWTPAGDSPIVGEGESSQGKTSRGGGGSSGDGKDGDASRGKTHPADEAAEEDLVRPFGTGGPPTFASLSDITISTVAGKAVDVSVNSAAPPSPPPPMPLTLQSPPPLPAELWTPMPWAVRP
ncbi:hypothetical protein MMPV_005606 [Pyropia vietnamensis]